ncbi:Protein CBR-MBR-1 [Caenorhabditis briggsae]|uniref:HTH psq-type domain-containing protein n=2 Tax=Caenorhabditis briggsae TaxID=6238 RepID=A0AAE8ZNF4_CAEBR|nr:Protein CBR-MBR-1 [Caenorhabditis briggsae]ULT81205.1 hypothetical protein L3Y34_011233 [Caenorhabditis briggsae]UMM40486.1 hypothetical protein L5515_017102 [Caenorhabditis briggsae]CAP25171.1 Protein CBR-MBR-1 [Caenorhabditis briggsae]
MNSEPKPTLAVSSHFMTTDNQDQYKGMYATNRLSIANLLSSPSQVMQGASENWQNIFLDRQLNESLLPHLLQNPWAINFWLQFQNSQLQPQLQYAAIARSFITENPLDLSNKTMNALQKLGALSNGDMKTEDEELTTAEKSPDDNKLNNSRRNYTIEDLTQAVDAIREGKLGTRRASVVYGIPRSTLRNKIYKLEAEGAIPSKIRRGKIAARRAEAEQKRCDEASAAAAMLDSFGNQSDSSSSSPHASMCPSSPDSTNSSVEGTEDTPESKKSSSPLDPKWLESIWQNLFKTQTGVVPAENGMTVTTVETDTPTTPTPEKAHKVHGTDEWKRSRPKRGQYRKYDKNALDEAVRSVRRGEMTVHRAGSFFGVPHSTLEYKVKERNLMRKKKDSLLFNNDSSTSEEGTNFILSAISQQSNSSSHTSTPIQFPISLV